MLGKHLCTTHLLFTMSWLGKRKRWKDFRVKQIMFKTKSKLDKNIVLDETAMLEDSPSNKRNSGHL